jgi:TonB family protein
LAVGALAGLAPATELPAAYAEAVAARDFDRLLAEINRQFDLPPLALTAPEPVYPEIAGQAGAEGTVKLLLWIDEGGTVRDVEVADSPGWLALEEAARKAAYTIRYRPAELDDRPVAAWYPAHIIFYIPPPGSRYP